MMLIALIVFLPFIGGLFAYLVGRKNEYLRNLIAELLTGAVLALACMLPVVNPGFSINGILISGLHFTTGGFRAVYAIITAIMWFGTTLFSPEYFRHEPENLNRYYFFMLVTLGATEGVMLSADLTTSFMFFEILSFTSFTWVIHEETREAVRAGYTYLVIAVIGGLVLFMGLALLYHAAGTLVFAELQERVASSSEKGMIFAAALCILFGFGCKAGMFPVHIWLPKAHPVAPSPGSALLSGILTKVGIYGILMNSLTSMMGIGAVSQSLYGIIVLLLGAVTMFSGALLALFSVNLKRTLACSSMSQIGFILTGMGMNAINHAAGCEEGAGIAFSGLVLHMTNHSLIKLTLFMCAGVVVMNLHTLILDEIRGWGRNKWILKIAFALGALGISGVPFFNGYISKTLLHEGIVEMIHFTHTGEYTSYVSGVMSAHDLSLMLSVIEWVFLISGGFTFAYMLKLFICIFVEKNSDPARQAVFDGDGGKCMNPMSTAVIFGSSLFMVVLGQPAVMTRLAGFMTGFEEVLEFEAFTLENLKGGFISLGIGAFVYLVIVRHVLFKNGSYVNLWPEKLDLENLIYRPVLTGFLPAVFGTAAAVFGENKVTRPLCAYALKAGAAAAALFGENRITAPASKIVLFLGTVSGRLLDTSVDGLILGLRKTAFREMKVKSGKPKLGFMSTLRLTTNYAMEEISRNFSFAMLLACGGIIFMMAVILILTFIKFNPFG